MLMMHVSCGDAVDEKERNTGNNPEKELLDSGFRDFQRPYVTGLIFLQDIKHVISVI